MNEPFRIRSVRHLFRWVPLVFAAGCAGSHPSPHFVAVRSEPIRGTVRLADIERVAPEKIFLDRVDQAIRDAERREAPPVATGLPAPSENEPKISRGNAASTRTRRIAAFQARRLAALQTGILTNLVARLQRADDQRLASIRSRLDTDLERNYASRVDAIDDQAEAGENLATAEDRDAAVNLLTKIEALTVDLSPPPTAPVGYWAVRLAARQAEFDALRSKRNALIARIRSGRDRSRQDLRTELQADADASFATAVASAKTRRDALAETARQRLHLQTADILASSKALDAEADAAALLAAQGQGGKMPADRDELPRSVSIPPANREDLGELLRERTQIQARIARQTMRTVKEVTRSRNAVVVGYTHADGVPDITDDVLKWVRADRWG